MPQTYQERMSVNLRPPICRSGKRWEEMVPMRDGVKLHTIFWMPDTDGPWPVLFSRTPYPKNQPIYEYQGKIFSERGYGFIYQYCRGTGASEGEWAPFENERLDGVDALQWLQQQDYIQSIGLYGFSYVAYTQWMVLDQLPPKVKTAYLVHFGTDRFRQMYANGLFRHDIYTPWAKDNCGADVIPPYEAALEAGLYKPHLEADRAVWNIDLPWYREWQTHPDYDSSFWKDSFWEELKAIPGKIQVPVYLGCGWYDHHFGGMMEGYRGLSVFAKEHSRLVMGPWVHHKQPCIDREDTDNAFAPGIHGYEGALCWMDRLLKNGELPEQEVMAYGVGQGWRELPHWPMKSQTRRYYFSSDGLTEKSDEEISALEYTYDPGEIIETRGAECMCYAPLAWRGSRLQPEPGTRTDQISLISEPLQEKMTLSGSVTVHLRVSTDAEDTAFVVRLMEITPEGKSYNIRTGATTLRYRNDSDKAQNYTPNQQVTCELKLWDILWQLPEGARIRIDIASSSFPEYNIHLNTAESWAEQKDAVIARQKVWIGGDSGSYIDLPLEAL